MDTKDTDLRSQIIDQALRARSEGEVSEAICQVDRWIEANPGDGAMRDLNEPLLLRQSAFRKLEQVEGELSVR